MPELVFEIEGEVDSVQLNRAMFILGELIINKVKDNIRDMNLINTGAFLQGWFSNWSNNTLTIENTQIYAYYLEYGTYGYWDQFGEEKFTDPMHPKKKDIDAELRSAFPTGMQPFAPVRRVLYNDAVMTELITKAFSV